MLTQFPICGKVVHLQRVAMNYSQHVVLLWLDVGLYGENEAYFGPLRSKVINIRSKGGGLTASYGVKTN